MSAKLNLKKSKILKRLQIPSFSEITHKESLLNLLKEKEPDLPLKRSTTKENNIKFESFNNNKKNKSEIKAKKSSDSFNLKLKLQELEKYQNIKDKELKVYKKMLEDEKVKVQNLNDIVAKKELKIGMLKKNLKNYEKQQNPEKDDTNESNKLIKIDIINKKIEYNLNLENIQLKEELKCVKNENIKLKEELSINRNKIIN